MWNIVLDHTLTQTHLLSPTFFRPDHSCYFSFSFFFPFFNPLWGSSLFQDVCTWRRVLGDGIPSRHPRHKAFPLNSEGCHTHPLWFLFLLPHWTFLRRKRPLASQVPAKIVSRHLFKKKKNEGEMRRRRKLLLSCLMLQHCFYQLAWRAPLFRAIIKQPRNDADFPAGARVLLIRTWSLYFCVYVTRSVKFWSPWSLTQSLHRWGAQLLFWIPINGFIVVLQIRHDAATTVCVSQTSSIHVYTPVNARCEHA